jgi:hypothetical protein
MPQVTREPLDTLEHLVNRVSSAIAGWVGQDGLAAMGLPVTDAVVPEGNIRCYCHRRDRCATWPYEAFYG